MERKQKEKKLNFHQRLANMLYVPSFPTNVTMLGSRCLSVEQLLENKLQPKESLPGATL
jgi:hypothetical protein